MNPLRWVNIFISNRRTPSAGLTHRFNFRKDPCRYLAEAQYCINRGFDLSSLVPRQL
jgi:hypothetical protein